MVSENKARVLRDAERFVVQGKFAQAIVEYQKVVRTDPSDVLTLNTIGDLFLRQGNIGEASRIFNQVAESYTRNNFLLKAIAVYKKILKIDPSNVDTQLMLASLFARQGVTVDARNHYLEVAERFLAEGRARECVEIYEKVVAIEPNNPVVRRKLANIYLAERQKDKAHENFVAAARAQVKAGELRGALESFRQALETGPEDFAALKGFLDCSIGLGDVHDALARVKFFLGINPEDEELNEMMGRAQLAARDLEGAARSFRTLVLLDESRYGHLLTVGRAFVEAGKLDEAVDCLEPVIPILIGRRESGRGAELCHEVLRKDPSHLPALMRLEEIYSDTNDESRHFEVLEKLAVHLVEQGRSEPALLYLEKLLLLRPDSEKYARLHRRTFAEVHPDAPYESPLEASNRQLRSKLTETVVTDPQATGEGSEPASLVEVDLLLTYGMADKAQAILDTMLARNPDDREARLRLANLLRDQDARVEAAEHLLLLAASFLKAANQEAADRHLSEARALAPESVGPDFDLMAYARQRGLTMPEASSGGATERRAPESASPLELDLSGDLTEMFFGPQPQSEPAPSVPEPSGFEPPVEVAEIPPKPIGSFSEQLQEVDFYLRLGFVEEARSKLDEIAREHSSSPEVAARYQQLSEAGAAGAAEQEPIATPAPNRGEAAVEALPAGGEVDIFKDLSFDAADVAAAPAPPPQKAVPPPDLPPADAARPAAEVPAAAPPPADQPRQRAGVNSMFADLMDEVSSLATPDNVREEFETHFNLGIAYREMALTEDAVKEFQEAARILDPEKFPRELVQCCGMLSTCYLEQNMPRSAIRWCQTGLNVSELLADEAMALRYDMGIAHTECGESDRALEFFQAIFGADPAYRDVAQRIDGLRDQGGAASRG